MGDPLKPIAGERISDRRAARALGAWARGVIARPVTWLVIFVVTYFSISFYFESTLYLGLQHTVGNLPVFMQALSSTVHGYIPMYESQDCVGKFRCSFLLVHPGFVMYAMAPFYALSPTPFTLFAIQSLGVALAAVPLYVLARAVTGSEGKALFAAGLYLVWAPILAATILGWWLESLLPLELFTVAACWELKRFRWGLVAAALAFATFEVGSIYGFLIGVFFLVPWVGAAFGSARREYRGWRTGAQGLILSARRWLGSVRWSLRQRVVRYTVLLMGLSLLAYVLEFVFMNEVGPRWLGAPSPPVPAGLSGLFYNSSAPRKTSLIEVLFQPALLLGAASTAANAEYWLILFALLGFLPLLAPRSLVIALPWIGFTFLGLTTRYTVIGVYPAGIAAVPLFIGVAYGLRRVPLFARGTARPALVGPQSDQRRSTSQYRVDPRPRRLPWAILIGGAVVANLLLSPIDPILPAVGAELGPAFVSPYFLSPEPVAYQYEALQQLVALVPYGATVATPPLLAPLTIDDVHAYVLTNKNTPQWNNQSRLPFSLEGGPYFVFITGSGGYLPPALAAMMANESMYDPRGYVSESGVGPVVLYERQFTGGAQEFGTDSGVYPFEAGPRDGPSVAKDGYSSYASSPAYIASWPNVTGGGPILSGTLPFLPVGNYTVTVESKLIQLHSPGKARPVVSGIGIQGFGQYKQSAFYRAANYTGNSWSSVTMRFSTQDPVLSPRLTCSLLSTDYQLAVAWISIAFTAAGP